MKKHGVPDQLLVCPRQAETEVGLEKESLMAGSVTTSPAPYLYERTVVTERDMLPIDPPPKFVLFASWIDLLVPSARVRSVCIHHSSSSFRPSGLVPDNWFTYVSTYVITHRVSCWASPPETEAAQDAIGKNMLHSFVFVD